MNIVLNLMGGSYGSDSNFSAYARRAGLGCLDIDNAESSGSSLADITANTVFSLCCHLNTAKRVAAVRRSVSLSDAQAALSFGSESAQVTHSLKLSAMLMSLMGRKIYHSTIVANSTSRT